MAGIRILVMAYWKRSYSLWTHLKGDVVGLIIKLVYFSFSLCYWKTVFLFGILIYTRLVSMIEILLLACFLVGERKYLLKKKMIVSRTNKRKKKRSYLITLVCRRSSMIEHQQITPVRGFDSFSKLSNAFFLFQIRNASTALLQLTAIFAIDNNK